MTKIKSILFLIIFLSISVRCNHQESNRVLSFSKVKIVNPASLCGPTPADLNTVPGYDGHLSPLFEGLDVYHYPITTESELAQKYFDQGFILNYGFNHAEAARSFREVTQIDPEAPMGYWGLAYVLGPNYNAPMFPDVLGSANEALNTARLLSYKANTKEQSLINALSKRYPLSEDIDPAPYYEAYAAAMKEVMNYFPEDVDIAVMTAESLMDLHPWDLWLNDGQPQPWTPEIMQILEKALDMDPEHPQAMHLYIHTMEASGVPEKALEAANALRHRVPGAGHLIHMPSHLYINLGMYHEGTLANERAVKIDSNYVESCSAAGVYPLALVPHNWHFLAACAGLEGNGKRAVEASKYMANYVVDQELMYTKDWATLSHFYSIPWFIMAKFEMWDEIFNETKPDPKLIYPTAIWEYSRALAMIANNDMSGAEKSLAYIEAAEKDTSIQDYTIFDINTIPQIITIAKNVVKAKMATKNNDFASAEKFYLKAIEYEDMLNYSEPPDWFFSVRHQYGALLLNQEKFAQAKKVYLEDLEVFPKNGWALKGLQVALVGLGEMEKAKKVETKFNVAWQWADTKLESSVIND